MPADPLPEGTDTIVEGAGVGATDEADADALDAAAAALTAATPPEVRTSPAAAAPDAAPAEPVSLSSRVDGLRAQAGDRARDFAVTAKDRVTSSIDDVVRLIQDAAAEVEERVGAGYGAQVRRAADGVAGFSDAIKAKDVDALFADARELVARSPGVAVGIAATLGFVLARLARAGIAEAAPAAGGRKAA